MIGTRAYNSKTQNNKGQEQQDSGCIIIHSTQQQMPNLPQHWLLAACAAAHTLQACPHVLPVRPWTLTGLPGRRHSAGRQDSRSTTPAVIIDLDCPQSVTERFPSPQQRTWNSLPAEVTTSNFLQTFKTKLNNLIYSWRRFHSL